MKPARYILISLLLASCGQNKSEPITTAAINKPNNPNPTAAHKPIPTSFVPKGFTLFEKVHGDLNKDGVADSVLILKGTDKSKIITDEYRVNIPAHTEPVIPVDTEPLIPAHSEPVSRFGY